MKVKIFSLLLTNFLLVERICKIDYLNIQPVHINRFILHLIPIKAFRYAHVQTILNTVQLMWHDMVGNGVSGYHLARPECLNNC